MKRIVFYLPLTLFVFVLFIIHTQVPVADSKNQLSPVMQRLVNRAVSMKNPTQTAALLRVPKMQHAIDQTYNIEPYESIINQVLNNGEQLVDTHYEFFHAQNGVWQLFQDVFKRLYERTINRSIENFYFFRYSLNDLYYSKYPNVSTFLKDHIAREGIIDDMSEVSSRLLSVNISLFSNVNYIGESTWYYFTESKSWIMPDRSIMATILQLFDYSTEFVDELMALGSFLTTPQGRLFQILVPKQIVDIFTYSAWTRGIPYNTNLIKDIVRMREKSPRPKIKEVVNSYITGWKNKETNAVNIVQNLLSGVDKGWYKISPVLDSFKENAAALPYFDTRQARMLIMNDYLLNPESGIIMFRYSTVPIRQQQAYEQALDALINKIIASKQTQAIISEVSPI